jgi:hypothetical protein
LFTSSAYIIFFEVISAYIINNINKRYTYAGARGCIVLSVGWLIIDKQKTVMHSTTYTREVVGKTVQEERNNSNNGQAQQTPNTKHGNKTEWCTPTVGSFVWHAPTKRLRSIEELVELGSV